MTSLSGFYCTFLTNECEYVNFSETFFFVSRNHAKNVIHLLSYLLTVLLYWQGEQWEKFDVIATVYHWYNEINNQLDATIKVH
jgi:hypothetical protein